ncbi:MAG TPA: flagellar biosynthetic protein FliO [Candidatus Hydrogenedentes bacterium]|nr:flagellar biosynthetic protein FliO [Candidatus Hydrogenedentota bacterium]
MNRLGLVLLMGCCVALGAWPQSQQASFQATTPPKVDIASPQGNAGADQENTPASRENSAPQQKDASGPKEVPEYFKEHQKIWDEPLAETANPAAAAATPAKEQGWNTYIPRTIMGLCIVCGIIILGGVLMKKYGRHTPLLAGQRLGVVLGKVYLTPKVSLHYVKSGGRVLVIGLTQNQVSLITEFEAGAFESALESEEVAPEKGAKHPGNFMEQLRTQVKKETGVTGRADEDLAELRGDIQRLQRYLQESARESNER